MRKTDMGNRLQKTALLFMALLFLAGCGSPDKKSMVSFQEGITHSSSANTAAEKDETTYADMEDAENTENQEDTGRKADGLYMVVANDLPNYQMTLLDTGNGREICYEYTDGTEFFDKYGNYTPASDFTPGCLVSIERINSNDTLGALAFTDRTWVYAGVRNYTIDPDRHRIAIADTNYSYGNDIRVFSEGQETTVFEIGKNDELTVYGVDRQIYSVVIDVGHGTLVLANTKLFEGGWLNLGTKVYTEITPDMRMDIPEGIYPFSVANDGYGDSGEVRIRRGKTTTIDLNDYKGEGPKMCTLKFDVGVDDAILAIDGKKIDYSKDMELKYGIYQLTVIADGYDTWSKQLVVNSPTASIDIALGSGSSAGSQDNQSSPGSSGSGNTDSSSSNNGKNSDNDGDSNDNTGNGNTNGGSAGSLAGSLAGTHAHSGSSSADSGSGNSGSGSSSNKNTSALADAALNSSLASIVTGGDSTDYLDTLSDLVDSLTKLSNRNKN